MKINMTKGKLLGKLRNYALAAALLTGCDGIYVDGKRVDNVNVEEERELEIVDGNKDSQPETRRDYRTTDFSDDSDEVILARMLYGEARNCSREEQIAVGYVALNRQARGRYGRTLRGVILRPSQFSCFNRNDPNRNVIMNPDTRAFESFVETARGILSREYQDNTQCATHYFNPRSANPSWAQDMTRIGRINGSRHEFYRED